MEKQVFKINEKMHALLIVSKMDEFTVLELRDAYLNRNRNEVCKIEARKFVYRQITRLLQKGLLLKQEGNTVRNVIYKKTDLFNKSTIVLLNLSEEQSAPNVSAVISFLQAELQQYQVDLSSSIAESEEYQRLHEKLPELKPQIEIYFMQAREKCSRLLGQVTAIETILTDYKKVRG
ncbi:response regulator [Photobacterium profundum]|uniref:Response regulator n=1 Tax=Photobacterium profundum 3TCK TaxID=314280 RepID=Q1YWW0_9GAMM|nr:hypothetical protein [Photobacterium profundum]EAS40742.1 hypothetical protein P3TCK_08648 [Photobacterium profundum 3TCK]PSV62707.1 response regulator [Photobacterium profundum]